MARVALEAPQYPVNLVVHGRPCLVVGGGPVAARKAAGLLGCGARVHLVAPCVGPEARALGARGDLGRGGLTWEERAWRPGECRAYWLVMVAVDDRDLAEAVAADAEAARVWVNVADDPALCAFTLPAVLRRGPVTVAVGTGGRSPAMAAWLRDMLGAEVGPEHAALAELVSAERNRLRAAGCSTEGLDWQSALDSDMLGLLRAGQVERARERLRTCLSLQ